MKLTAKERAYLAKEAYDRLMEEAHAKNAEYVDVELQKLNQADEAKRQEAHTKSESEIKGGTFPRTSYNKHAWTFAFQYFQQDDHLQIELKCCECSAEHQLNIHKPDLSYVFAELDYVEHFIRKHNDTLHVSEEVSTQAPAKQKDTKQVIAEWEEVAKTDLWQLEKQLRASTKKKQEEELETALDRFHNILSTRAKIRQEIESEIQRMAEHGY